MLFYIKMCWWKVRKNQGKILENQGKVREFDGMKKVGTLGGARNMKSVAAFSGHLFYDLFSKGRGAMAPSAPPRIRYW